MCGVRGRTCGKGEWFWALGCLALAGLIGCQVSGLAGPTVQGSGVVKTEKREVSGFTAIDVGGAIQLDFATGTEAKVEVTTDDNLLPLTITEVKGDTLHLHMKGSTSTNQGVRVRVTAPSLRALTASGATHSTLAGLGEKVLKLTVSGASEVNVTGTAEQLEVACSGASKVLAAKLQAHTVNADASGASSIEVNAAKELAVKASGASTVRYEGSPTTKISTSGASSVGKK